MSELIIEINIFIQSERAYRQPFIQKYKNVNKNLDVEIS